jgi:hypothetical protein
MYSAAMRVVEAAPPRMRHPLPFTCPNSVARQLTMLGEDGQDELMAALLGRHKKRLAA